MSTIETDVITQSSLSGPGSPLESKKFLSTVLSALPCLVAYVDCDLKYQYVNSAYEKWFGLSRDECLNKHLIEVVGESALSEVMPYFEAAFRGEVQSFIRRMFYKTGGARQVQINLFPDVGIGGHVQGFTLIVNDLTEQMIEQTKLKLIYETIEDGLMITDSQRNVIQYNRAALAIFELAEEAFLSRSPSDPRCNAFREDGSVLPAEDFPSLVALRTGQRIVGTVIGFDLPSGNRRWIKINATPYYCRSGLGEGSVSDLRILSTFSDCTQFKEVEKKQAQLIESEKKARLAAEGASRIKEEFLATLSHELRTPLTTILGWAQMLKEGWLDPEETARGLAILEKSANTQARLIDDILDMASIHAGKVKLSLQQTDPRKIVATSIDVVQNLAQEKRIRIESEIDSLVGTLLVDPGRLQQILCNLLTNAIRFSYQNGKVVVKLDLQVKPSGNVLQIQVIDDGKGIKPEFIGFVFDRFSQADSTTTRAYGGLGLGLAIVGQLVGLHQGTVTVESLGEGKGSNFTVLLPIRHGESVKEPISGGLERDTSLEGVSILLVEDEESIREVLTMLLQSYGARVKSYPSASTALEGLIDFKPDVIVSDIAMPGEDGYSFIRKVRALSSELARTPAIALTAYAREEDIQRAIAAGFQTHFKKPVDTIELVRLIQATSNSRTLN